MSEESSKNYEGSLPHPALGQECAVYVIPKSDGSMGAWFGVLVHYSGSDYTFRDKYGAVRTEPAGVSFSTIRKKKEHSYE